jgi:diguanylate cyclase
MDLPAINFSSTLALAVVAALGYLFGRSAHTPEAKPEIEQARRDLKRAKSVARELEQISAEIRKSLATHHASVARFKDRVTELSGSQTEASWQELCKEAEEMLKPTLRLAAEIAHAYDEIRQQSNHLMTFTELRTDPLTRVSNRRALDECLENMFSLMNRYEQPFSIAIFDIDHFKQINDQRGHVQGDQILQRVARIIDDNVRDTDVVARYGGEEFVVVMPHTGLSGANIFSERLRAKLEDQIDLTVSGGVAQAKPNEDAPALVGRADAALYAAKAAGRNCVFQHNGDEVEPIHLERAQPPLAVPEAAS